MTLKVKVSQHHFNRLLKCPMIHNWCKCGEPRSKAWRIIARTSPIWEVLAPNDLEGPGQIPPCAILSENYQRYTCKRNLGILVTFFQKLSHGQASTYRKRNRRRDRRPYGRTDGRRQRQYPFGRSGLGVKTK